MSLADEYSLPKNVYIEAEHGMCRITDEELALLTEHRHLGGAITVSIAWQDSLLLHEGRVSVGRPLKGVTLKIVDPITLEELPEEFEGEIWVQSGSTAEGYWNSQEDETFGCRLKGTDEVGPRSHFIHAVADVTSC